MVGPGQGIPGGIRSLTELIVPPLRRRVDLRYLPTACRRAPSKSGKISVQNAVLAILQYSRFVIMLASFRPHLVHIHTSEGIGWLKDTFYVFVAKMVGCKVIIHMHGFHFVELHNQNSPFLRRYTRRALALADQVIEVSEQGGQELAGIVPEAQIRVFHNCTDVDACARPATLNLSQETAVLFLGTVGARKGVYDLLAAVAIANGKGCPLNLFLAGPGEHADELEKVREQARELHEDSICSIVGTVQGRDKERLLHGCDVFVLPSYHEAMPMAILEAMAAGKPIVATGVGGVGEVVLDGYNGFLVAPGDVEALADRLMILAAQPRLREIMGRRSREIIRQQFDVAPYVDRLVALYESVVDAEGTSSSRVQK